MGERTSTLTRSVPHYDEIELRVEHSSDDRYLVRASAEDGVADAPFELRLSRDRVDYLVLKAAMPRRGVRRMESSAIREVTELGDGLFRALFREDVRDLYRTALAHADGAGRGLRIKLSLTDVPELMGLPWEFLYEEPGFLAISRFTPVVRYVDISRTRRPREVEPPLRILGVVSSPIDAAPLDVDNERANLETALGELVSIRAVQIDWLDRATLPALLETLRDNAYHVLHYIGHGAYKPEVQDGVLIFEDQSERAHEVSSRRLGAILHDHDTLRLAVLNSCEGARSSEDDPFSGVATTLLQQGIPAVIAMQFEITDRAAIVLANQLYSSLAKGLPIDIALTEARKAIWADDNDVEWGTPVLFMRVADGRLFTLLQSSGARDVVSAPGPTLPAPESATPSPLRLPRPRWRLAALATILLVVVVCSFVVLRGGGSPHSPWATLPSMPVAVDGAAVGAYDGRLWVIGGISAAEGRPILNDVNIYDPGTHKWRPGPSLPVPLYYASLASTGSQLYVLGGLSPQGSVSTVYRLDSPTAQWRVVGHLPAARGAGGAAWDGHRLVFGGGVRPDGRAASDVWALEDGHWRPLGRLHPAREKLATATDGNGTVWFMAGRDANTAANAFSAVDIVKADSVHRAGSVSAVQGAAGVWWPSDGVCLIGGEAATGWSGQVKCLAVRAHLPPLPAPRAGLGAAVIGNTVFVAGGYDAGHQGTRTVESFDTAAAVR